MSLAVGGQRELPFNLSWEQKARMMARLAISWDGQWFLKTAEECGLETGVRLNARVRQSFGRIEMRTLLQTVGLKEAANLAEAASLLELYWGSLLGADSEMKVELREEKALIEVYRCPPYEGARKANLGNSDQSCIACSRLWDTWLGVLRPRARVKVDIKAQMGAGADHCVIVLADE